MPLVLSDSPDDRLFIGLDLTTSEQPDSSCYCVIHDSARLNSEFFAIKWVGHTDGNFRLCALHDDLGRIGS